MNPETMKARFDIDVRISSEVTAIDRENKKLAVFDKKSGETYEEPYDDLVICLLYTSYNKRPDSCQFGQKGRGNVTKSQNAGNRR